MDDQSLLERITANPDIFSGKPIIRGMRISVEMVLSLLAQGVSKEDVIADYPELLREDIQACLAFAAQPGREETDVPSFHDLESREG